MLEFIQSAIYKLHKVIFVLLYKSSFKSFGGRSTLQFPFKVNGAKHISVGNNVHIEESAWLLAYKNAEGVPRLSVGDNTYIGRMSHIVSVRNIEIGEHVLIADKVYVSDNLHAFSDIKRPIKYQEIRFKKEVFIGDNSWLGENVCVIGASVGKHCVIGANSVVNKDIPDYSVAVGAPAKVIKQYNHTTKVWEAV